MKSFHAVTVALVVALATLSACASSGGTTASSRAAIAYNDRFSDMTEAMGQVGTDWANAFNQARASRDFSGLRQHRERGDQLIANAIAEAQASTPVGVGGAAFRDSFVEFMHAEKRLVATLAEAESLPNGATDAQIEAFVARLSAAVAEDQVANERLTEAQRAYGANNDFTIAQ